MQTKDELSTDSRDIDALNVRHEIRSDEKDIRAVNQEAFGQENEALLEDFYIGIFIRFYKRVEDFLPVIRNDPPLKNSPFGELRRIEIYCTLEWLYARWEPRYDKLIQGLREEHIRKKGNEPFLG